MPTYYSVIVNKNGAVERNRLIVGYNRIILSGIYAGKGVSDLAEEWFVDECRKIEPDISDEDLEACLDNGYMESGDYFVCIMEIMEVA